MRMRRRKEEEYRDQILDKGSTKMTLQTQQRLTEDLKKIRLEIVKKTAELGKTMDSAQDWHDNAAYDVLLGQLDVLETMQLSYSTALDEPEIIRPREETDNVQLGNTVEVRYQGEEESEQYTILGPQDNATNRNWISEDSDLAAALMGCQAGSKVTLQNGLSVDLIKILPGDF